MTTYRLMDGTGSPVRPGDGPGAPTAYAGPFLAGVLFSVTSQVMWLNGYYHWVPAGGDTAARKFALWNRYSASAQQIVPGSVVTSGTLTAGQWNFAALPSPVQLAPGALYVAATGWTSVGGFPDTQNQFASGQPYAAGIVNGPLTAWSDATAGGTRNWPGPSANYGLAQGLFGVSGADPSVDMPASGSGSANFWVDVLVDDTAPPGYSGSYRVWPNMADVGASSADTAANFTLGMEFTLSQACTLDNVWFYSPPGVTQLPAECAVYDAGSQAIVSGTDNTSPSWTLPGGGPASAGAGWVYAPMPGSVSLPAGDYKVVVANTAGSPAIWNNQSAGYWTTGFGGSGLTAGPVTVPGNATATAPGQDTYHAGTPIRWPDTSTGQGHNYWVDVEVTPVSAVAVSLAGSGAGTDSVTVAAAATAAGSGAAADSGTVAAAVPLAEPGTGDGTISTAAALGLADPGGAADGLAVPGAGSPLLSDAGEAGDGIAGLRRSCAFPDAELLLIGWLQPQFPATRWCTELPADITETTVHVTRVSGGNRSLRVDRPVVDVDVFAADHATSVAVALGIQALLTVARNVVTGSGVLQSVNTVNGPRWLPEINPALRRRSATYELHVHA